MDYLWIISCCFGVVGVVVNAIIFWQKNREKLLSVKLIGDVVWTLHYALISAWTGAATCGISIAREIVFLNRQHRWARSNLWLIFFMALSVLAGVLTWQNIFNLLPVCASVLSVVSFFIGKPRLSRIFQIFISIMFLLYDIHCLSYAGMVNEACTLTSIFISIIYFKIKEKQSSSDS